MLPMMKPRITNNNSIKEKGMSQSIKGTNNNPSIKEDLNRAQYQSYVTTCNKLNTKAMFHS